MHCGVVVKIKQVNICQTIRAVTDAYVLNSLLDMVNLSVYKLISVQRNFLDLFYSYCVFSVFSFGNPLFECWISRPDPKTFLSFLIFSFLSLLSTFLSVSSTLPLNYLSVF